EARSLFRQWRFLKHPRVHAGEIAPDSVRSGFQQHKSRSMNALGPAAPPEYKRRPPNSARVRGLTERRIALTPTAAPAARCRERPKMDVAGLPREEGANGSAEVAGGRALRP